MTLVRNWSGSLSFSPSSIEVAQSAAEVVEGVKFASANGHTLRPIGARHSSSSIYVTAGMLLDCTKMTGLAAQQTTDLADEYVSVLPGTSIAETAGLLAGMRRALTNVGDVDYQTIAGALATGTHGTGITLGNLSTMLVGGVLITGTGETLAFGVDAGEAEDSDLVRAVQVSMGSLGVLVSLTLKTVPLQLFRLRKWMTHIDWVFDHFDELVRSNRHFDMYWYPRSDLAQVRTLQPLDAQDGPIPEGRTRVDAVGFAHQLLPNDRTLKFNEMEYMLPFEHGRETFARVRERIKARHRDRVAWRVLVRTIAADRAMLSPSYERETLSIALLHHHHLPFQGYFNDIEPMLTEAAGRPHWGKHHSLRATRLKPLYPDWERFHEHRMRLDPNGLFMTPELHALIGDEDR